jgi:hypothetical protein
MTKLVLLKRNRTSRFAVGNMNREGEFLRTDGLDSGSDHTEAEVFFVNDDHDEQILVEHLTGSNPGKDVEVYELASSHVCPAAEMVTKVVSKAGVLPAAAR